VSKQKCFEFSTESRQAVTRY